MWSDMHGEMCQLRIPCLEFGRVSAESAKNEEQNPARLVEQKEIQMHQDAQKEHHPNKQNQRIKP
jgi:hypothetical protein